MPNDALTGGEVSGGGKGFVNHAALVWKSLHGSFVPYLSFRGSRAPDYGVNSLPLKLSLKPGEKFVLNGAVLQNGDRRAVLILQNRASVLREKDIMQPEAVVTPARMIYFPIMMMY